MRRGVSVIGTAAGCFTRRSAVMAQKSVLQSSTLAMTLSPECFNAARSTIIGTISDAALSGNPPEIAKMMKVKPFHNRQ
jgi:hypothetical protein